MTASALYHRRRLLGLSSASSCRLRGGGDCCCWGRRPSGQSPRSRLCQRDEIESEREGQIELRISTKKCGFSKLEIISLASVVAVLRFFSIPMLLARRASRGLDKTLAAPVSAPRHTSRHYPSAVIRSAPSRGSQGAQSKAKRFRVGGASSSPSSSSPSSSPSLLVPKASSSCDREEGAHSLPAYIHPPIPVEAIATHPHYHPDKNQQPLQMKNAHRLVLFLVYASAALALAGAFPSPAALLPSTAAAAALLATVWLSFVLAISFTEAWVKFRAPTLTKPAAVDAGRHVFAALNAVETGLATGLIAALFLLPARPASSPPLLEACRRLAAVPLAALALQVGWLTPSLDRRARELIVSSWRKNEKKNEERKRDESEDEEEKARAAVLEMEAHDRGTPVPPGWRHGLYVALEAVKVVSLALLVKSAGRGAFV